MNNVAKKYHQQNQEVNIATAANADDFSEESAIRFTREVLILGGILALLQVMDGVLTAIGVGHFGHASEANLAIRYLMDLWGHIPALVVVKGFAICVVGALIFLSRHVAWIPQAMKAVIALYMGAAIIPWTGVLVTKVL